MASPQLFQCQMCGSQIKFGEEICEKCLPYSAKFVEIRDRLESCEHKNHSLKDFLRLMLTKVVKNEPITDENKETWVKLAEEDTVIGFNYYENLESYQKYHEVDYDVIFTAFGFFSERDNYSLKQEGYLNAMKRSLARYIKYHQWKDVKLCDNQKVVERINLYGGDAQNTRISEPVIYAMADSLIKPISIIVSVKSVDDFGKIQKIAGESCEFVTISKTVHCQINAYYIKELLKLDCVEFIDLEKTGDLEMVLDK